MASVSKGTDDISEDYEIEAELMLNTSQNYGLNEFPEVVVEVRMVDDDLADELEEIYIDELECRDQDSDEEYGVVT